MGTNERRNRCDTLLWDELKKHRGHHISIASYEDWDDPENISLESILKILFSARNRPIGAVFLNKKNHNPTY